MFGSDSTMLDLMRGELDLARYGQTDEKSRRESAGKSYEFGQQVSHKVHRRKRFDIQCANLIPPEAKRHINLNGDDPRVLKIMHGERDHRAPTRNLSRGSLPHHQYEQDQVASPLNAIMSQIK
jgi:hypothetical protein